jgi:hypothetical protein
MPETPHVLVAELRIDHVERLLTSFESFFDKGKQQLIPFLRSAEETANVTFPTKL